MPIQGPKGQRVGDKSLGAARLPKPPKQAKPVSAKPPVGVRGPAMPQYAEGHPIRRAQLNRAANLFGKGHLNRAQSLVAKINPSAAEYTYLRIESQKRGYNWGGGAGPTGPTEGHLQAGYKPYKNQPLVPALGELPKGYEQQRQRNAGQKLSRAASRYLDAQRSLGLVDNLSGDLVPSPFVHNAEVHAAQTGADLAGAARMDRLAHAGEQAQLRKIKAESEKNQRQLENIVNPFSPGNLSAEKDMAWQMTGIPAIRSAAAHPGRSLTGDAWAAAGILPFAKFGKAAETLRGLKGAEEAAAAAKAAGGAKIAARTAKAERLAQTAEDAKGIRAGVAGKRAARLNRKLAMRSAPRNEAETQAHIAENIKQTKNAGIGLQTPILEPGQISDRTGGALGAKIRAALAQLPDIWKAQEGSRIPDRARVYGRLRGAQEQALKSGDPFGNMVKAGTARAGKLSAEEFHGFDNLTPQELDQAVLHMAHNTDLLGHPLQNALLALHKAITEGKPLTEGEAKLFDHAFGREVDPAQVAKDMAAGRSGWDKAMDVAGVPRALMSSGDVSGLGRQTIGALAYDPKVWSEGLGPMFKSLAKEGNYQALQEAVHSRPNFPLYERGGLALPDLGKEAGQVTHATQEVEGRFISNAAEKLNLRELPIKGVQGKKWATGPGDLVRMSDRNYSALLTVIRTGLFDKLLSQAVANGWNIDDHLLKSIGDLSNVLTGRGRLLPGHGVTMNALFFSPKLLYSRLNMLGFGGGGLRSAVPGSWYASLHPFARAEAARATGQLFGTLSTVLFMARMLGARVNTDPRNADFGKIRIGNTRIDIAAGLQQPIRLLSQVGTGQVVSSTSGKLENLGGGFAGRSRLDVIQQFLEGKLAPIPSMGVDLAKQQQFNGQPLDWSLNPLDTNSEIAGHLTPLAAQDAINTEQQTHSLAAGLGGGALSALGVGVGSYSAQKANSPDKVKAANTKALTTLNKEMDRLKVPPAYRAIYTKATRIQVERDLAKAQARKDAPSGKISQADSYRITMQTLRKSGLMTPTQYKAAVAAIPRMNDRELAHWEYEAWAHMGPNNVGPGLALEQFHHYYNVTTGSTG